MSPSLLVQGVTHSHAGEGGRGPIPTRGQTLWPVDTPGIMYFVALAQQNFDAPQTPPPPFFTTFLRYPKSLKRFNSGDPYEFFSLLFLIPFWLDSIDQLVALYEKALT